MQRQAWKLISSHDYKSLNEYIEWLDILSFDQSVFLNKANLMYKIYNNSKLLSSNLLELQINITCYRRRNAVYLRTVYPGLE